MGGAIIAEKIVHRNIYCAPQYMARVSKLIGRGHHQKAEIVARFILLC
jgi:hypothetical protein